MLMLVARCRGRFLVFNVNFAVLCHTIAIWLTIALAIFRYICVCYPTRGADTSTPDSSTPDPSTPDTNSPDTSTPNSNTPDPSTRDRSTPDPCTSVSSAPDSSTRTLVPCTQVARTQVRLLSNPRYSAVQPSACQARHLGRLRHFRRRLHPQLHGDVIPFTRCFQSLQPAVKL